MRLSARATVLAVALFTAFHAGRAQPQQADPRSSILVSTDWLATHLHDANLVLLHVGRKESYDKEHIPGARYVVVSDLMAPMKHDGSREIMVEMPGAAELHAALAALGISDDSRVVIYFGNEENANWTSATRVMYTLDYAGLGGRTSLLDGGMKAWLRAGKPATADVPAPRAGALAPLHFKPNVVTGEWVHEHLAAQGFVVIDARDGQFYDGVSEGGPAAARRKGHIPGAKSVPFTSVTNDAGELKGASDLATIFLNAGVKPGDTVVGYCHVGLQATAMLFAARTLGFNVLLYDGSFEDWAYHAWPVELPQKSGGGTS